MTFLNMSMQTLLKGICLSIYNVSDVKYLGKVKEDFKISVSL